jgi:cellulose synthase/poly-beta-1,6-N-acetylglucosamine synthase-like glycosyltransferase
MTLFWMIHASNATAVARVLFWASAALLVYVYVGYPLLLSILAAFSRRKAAQPGYLPTISVLIAARNEEASIGRKLQETASLDYPEDKLEIIVLSDGSTDRTDEIVAAHGDPRVRLLRMPERKGKTHAQNQGAGAARGEILVFSDATTIYHPQALRYLAANYRDPSVGAVSGRYQYFDPEQNSPTGSGSIAFWNYENLIKMFQSRIRTITGCCGCIYSVRKSAYSELPADIISDLVQPLWVIQKGYRVVFENRALAFEETTQSTAEEFSMRVRVVTRAIRGLLSVPDLLKPWKYPWVALQLTSHKVLRWLVPLFLIALFVSNAVLAGQPVYRFVFALQLVFYLFALFSTRVPVHRYFKLLSLPLYFCTLNLAALLSIIAVFRGRKYVVWETVRSQP